MLKRVFLVAEGFFEFLRGRGESLLFKSAIGIGYKHAAIQNFERWRCRLLELRVRVGDGELFLPYNYDMKRVYQFKTFLLLFKSYFILVFLNGCK